MHNFKIKDMSKKDTCFVGTCTHVNDIPETLTRAEIELAARKRLLWLQSLHQKGVRTRVACFDKEPVGFIHLIPIKLCPLGPLGENLLVIPCLVVKDKVKGMGTGRRLIENAMFEAERQGFKGVVVKAYYNDHWFMPGKFFERCGFEIVKRKEYRALLWKVIGQGTAEPEFFSPDYSFYSQGEKVTIDLFWNSFCPTSYIETIRVREIAGEFQDKVILNEYCADRRDILLHYQISRGIFLNGSRIWSGKEISREKLREEIELAISGK